MTQSQDSLYPLPLPDISTWPSSVLGKDMLVSWPRFYEHGREVAPAIAQRYPHDYAVVYGSKPQNFLDVLRPNTEPTGAAVLYFHGGRWSEGHPYFYHQLAPAWLDLGVTMVFATYRQLPSSTINDAVSDAITALQWLHAHADNYGIDREALSVAGHSAGAHLASMVSLTQRAGVHLRAAVLMSGVYGISAFDSRLEAGEESDVFANLNPNVGQVVISNAVPELIRREDAPDTFDRQAEQLTKALEDKGFTAKRVVLHDADHVRTAEVFGDAESELFTVARTVITGQERS